MCGSPHPDTRKFDVSFYRPSVCVIIFTLNSAQSPSATSHPHQNEILLLFHDIYRYFCLQFKSKWITFRFFNFLKDIVYFLNCISYNPKDFIWTDNSLIEYLGGFVIPGVTENVDEMEICAKCNNDWQKSWTNVFKHKGLMQLIYIGIWWYP